MPKNCDVIIVGSGIGGLAAAACLAAHGLKILLLDENSHPGGQFLRPGLPIGPNRRDAKLNFLQRQGLNLQKQLSSNAVSMLTVAQVLGIFPEHTLLVEDRPNHLAEYSAETLILATGARERYLPFRGWTLPGVMGTGAAQILMKSAGMLPGRNILIAGNSPLMPVVAAEILRHGGKLHSLLHHGGSVPMRQLLAAGPRILPRVVQGAAYLARLVAARVPVRRGVRIIEARGRRQLETVTAGRVDARGRVIAGTETHIDVDTLAIGYGFAPNLELAQQAGCTLAYAPDQGGWCVDINDSMETSLKNIYAAGEITGIAGAAKSLIEGQISAWKILLRQGRVNRRTAAGHVRRLRRQRKQELQYGRFLNQLCRIDANCYAGIPDDTIVCRCEEISMQTIRRQVQHGFTTMRGLKTAARCGMGHCQGRTCGPILFDIISALTQQQAETVGYTSARAPVKMVSLGALARIKEE